MPRTDAVLFDLDGTLALHDQDGDALLERTFDRVGVDRFADQLALREATNAAPDAEDSVSFMANAFKIAAERADADPVPATDLAATYVGMIDHSAVHFRDGAREALESVGDRPIGLVTNGERAHQRQKLESLGIEGTFDAIVYGGDTVPAKPATEPFDVVLDEIGVAPGDAVHVGNSLADDVAGANRAGVTSVWVPTDADREESATAEPMHTLDSLETLPTIL
ncbi:MAG: HAD family hydrolase [Halanaeroarchaeum sp.]